MGKVPPTRSTPTFLILRSLGGLLLLGGCASSQGNSVYLQNSDGQIAECSLAGGGIWSPYFDMGIAEHILFKDCVKRWQERGYATGNHDTLKTQYNTHPAQRADEPR